MKPIVDGLERQLGDAVRVVRADIRAPEGAALAERYGVRLTPGLVAFDRSGRMARRWTGRIVGRGRMRKALGTGTREPGLGTR